MSVSEHLQILCVCVCACVYIKGAVLLVFRISERAATGLAVVGEAAHHPIVALGTALTLIPLCVVLTVLHREREQKTGERERERERGREGEMEMDRQNRREIEIHLHTYIHDTAYIH